jgi:signal transduction histidine kinase
MTVDGVRLLRDLQAALDAADRAAAALVAAVRVLVPALADACLIRTGSGSGELVTSGPVPATVEDRPIEIPLVHRGVHHGAMHLVRGAQWGGWSDDDRLLAEDCAGRIAQMIEARHDTEAASAASHYDLFLATLSHELRTPLTVSIGWLDLLRGERLTHAKRTQAFEIVDRNLRTQIRLIEDILEASRIVSGKMRLELASVPAVDLVVGAVEGMRPLAEAARIALDVTAGPAFALRGDGVRLGQVIHNLVGNSIRYTPPGGHVAVTLGRDGDTAVLDVVDDGGGIDPAFLPYVFDRFRQGERKRSGGSRGLGVGLFIVRHIVELHGGTVAATSEGRGKGSRFTVRLPLSGPG